MKINIPREWYEAKDSLEDGFTIGAGTLGMEPNEPYNQASATTVDEGRIAFGQFVVFSRRKRGLTIEALAEEADVELAELIAIEQHDPYYQTDPRTVYQLANYLNVSRSRLMVLAGLSQPNDNMKTDALKFAARSASVEKLTAQEMSVLEGYVSLLTERTLKKEG